MLTTERTWFAFLAACGVGSAAGLATQLLGAGWLAGTVLLAAIAAALAQQTLP